MPLRLARGLSLANERWDQCLMLSAGVHVLAQLERQHLDLGHVPVEKLDDRPRSSLRITSATKIRRIRPAARFRLHLAPELLRVDVASERLGDHVLGATPEIGSKRARIVSALQCERALAA